MRRYLVFTMFSDVSLTSYRQGASIMGRVPRLVVQDQPHKRSGNEKSDKQFLSMQLSDTLSYFTTEPLHASI